MKSNNVLMLAYLGDAVYEIYIRTMLINKGLVKVDKLQKEAVKYVSAKAQSDFLKKLIKNNLLNPIELEVVMRARNHKINHRPKNTDILTYKHATALEALIGYLYIEKKHQRLEEIIAIILEDNYVRIW